MAPKTAEHIRRLGELGAYNTNHFFRVDRGFVAQTADVLGGRRAPLDALQREVAGRTVPLEVVEGVKHDRRGILSMARHDGEPGPGAGNELMMPWEPMRVAHFDICSEQAKPLDSLPTLQIPTVAAAHSPFSWAQRRIWTCSELCWNRAASTDAASTEAAICHCHTATTMQLSVNTCTRLSNPDTQYSAR